PALVGCGLPDGEAGRAVQARGEPEPLPREDRRAGHGRSRGRPRLRAAGLPHPRVGGCSIPPARPRRAGEARPGSAVLTSKTSLVSAVTARTVVGHGGAGRTGLSHTSF